MTEVVRTEFNGPPFFITGPPPETELDPTSYYETVNGFVRQRVLQENLNHAIGETLPRTAPLECLDHAGADGRDAVWLAEQGHNVYVAAYTKNSRDDVQTVIDNQRRDIASHITLAKSPGRLHRRKRAAYDVIVKHGLLASEVDEPTEQLKTYRRMLRKGGLLSIILAGSASELSAAAEKSHYHDIGLYAVQARIASPLQLVRYLGPSEERGLISAAIAASRTDQPQARLFQLLAVR
jgi:hypothetical protein